MPDEKLVEWRPEWTPEEEEVLVEDAVQRLRERVSKQREEKVDDAS